MVTRVIFHPRVRHDLREILGYYDSRSDVAGDQFFEEFNRAVEAIEENPSRWRLVDDSRRRCNLKKFPFHLIFEIHGDEVRITVLRHHKRHPSYGLRRRW